MDVQARWAPTGLSVRLMIHHDGEDDIEDVRLDVRTDGGVLCRLLPGRRSPGVDVDLTRIPAHDSIWMNVEPVEPVPEPVSALHVQIHVGDELVHDGPAPITGGDR